MTCMAFLLLKTKKELLSDGIRGGYPSFLNWQFFNSIFFELYSFPILFCRAPNFAIFKPDIMHPLNCNFSESYRVDINQAPLYFLNFDSDFRKFMGRLDL